MQYDINESRISEWRNCEWLRCITIAEAIGCSDQHVRNLADRYQVEIDKEGRNVLYRKSDILKIIEKIRNGEIRLGQIKKPNHGTGKVNETSLNLYQSKALETAFYPQDYPIPYLALALVGEAGEVADKIKKVLRDENGIFNEESRKEIIKECGDVLWYLSVLAKELGYDLEKVATINIEKINSRMIRGLICGSGDNR